MRATLLSTAYALLALVVTACGSSGTTALIGGSVQPGSYLISGTLSGLAAGRQITLLDNGTDPTVLSSNGVFTFATPVVGNGSYSVTIGAQPTGATCSVSGGSGTAVKSNVTSITVTCSTHASSFSIGGTVSGLGEGDQVTLLNNGADTTTIAANGSFSFASPVPFDGSYAVTVAEQPVGQTCTVSGGSGAGVTADVTAVRVTCSTTGYSIGGTVSGLADGQHVTLLNNGADPTTVTGATFTFSTAVASNGGYSVTVGTQPTGQTCTVSGGSGDGVTANVTSVAVTCSTNTFTIGGSVSGLEDDEQVTLFDNGTDATTVTSNTNFTFATPVAYNGSYAVTVSTQPVGKTCTVSGGSGSGVTANVTAVTVTCSTTTFTIGGSVSGLGDGLQVTLYNNSGDALTLTANGTFTFATPVAYNGSYDVTVSTQPTGQTCTVSSGSGSGVTANVTAVTVTCSTNTYTIGGSISGLGDGVQVTLYNNGGDALTLTANGTFTFTTPVAYNGSYNVTVSTQPTGQTCTVSSGSGSGVTTNVTAVTVTCSTNTFTIGGSVSGLGDGLQVTLYNNGGDALTLNANGTFTFATPVAYNGSYDVTVNTQPTGQTCTVSSGSGSGVAANVTAVTVSCVTTPTFTVSGTIVGYFLPSGWSVTVSNNNANPVTFYASGSVTFATNVSENGSYSLSVTSIYPSNVDCFFNPNVGTPSSGSNVTANVTEVQLVCYGPD